LSFRVIFHNLAWWLVTLGCGYFGSSALYCSISAAQREREIDVSRLSDAELIQQLVDQAEELGIEIDLNYRFAQKSDE
jgi:hypothetical protein